MRRRSSRCAELEAARTAATPADLKTSSEKTKSSQLMAQKAKPKAQKKKSLSRSPPKRADPLLGVLPESIWARIVPLLDSRTTLKLGEVSCRFHKLCSGHTVSLGHGLVVDEDAQDKLPKKTLDRESKALGAGCTYVWLYLWMTYLP